MNYSREKEGGGVAKNFAFMLTVRLGVDRSKTDVCWKLCGYIHDNHTPSLSIKSHRNQKWEPKDWFTCASCVSKCTFSRETGPPPVASLRGLVVYIHAYRDRFFSSSFVLPRDFFSKLLCGYSVYTRRVSNCNSLRFGLYRDFNGTNQNKTSPPYSSRQQNFQRYVS